MFDTHIHLNDEKLLENLDVYLKEAKESGVNNFLVVGFDYDSSLKAIEIAQKYENCYAAIGFHPCDINKITDIRDLWKFLRLFNNEKVVCLGEIGLDYYWVKELEERERQKEMFIYQLALAKDKNLPTSIHIREATQDALDILKKHAKTPFVLHCFNASEEILNEYLKLDCYFAIGGVVTFKNATNLQEVVKKIPLDRLLIETDAPYLSPVPYRGKLNEPKYIKETLKFIADLRGMSFEELDKITTENAKKVFLNGK
jgi:TatD DNase family protein